MIGSIWSFIKRHRRKFLFTGILFGGAILLGRYAKKRILEYQESEANECLMQLRKQHHFDNNHRNCNTTVLSLLPRLRETLCRLLNSEALTSQLKNKPANKMEIWEELKILSFTRTIVAVYSTCMLSLYLRVQLNILGGYMYQDTLNIRNRKNDAKTTNDVQKHYLAMVQYLFDEGMNDLVAVVRSAVENVVSGMSLKDSMSAVDVRNIVTRVRDQVEGSRQNGDNGSMNCDLNKFFMAPNEDGEARSLTSEELFFRQLVNETRDVLNGSDFSTVLTLCLDSSFHWLANRTSEYFRPISSSNGIISLAQVVIPLAKVTPVVNGLFFAVLADPPNPMVQELLLSEQVKDFAVNIYDSFCEPPAGHSL